MTEDGIQEVADRLSDVLVHVSVNDPKAMVDLCDWFRSLKSVHLTSRRHNMVGIMEAAARVLEKMIEQNNNCGVEVFNKVRNGKMYTFCRSTASNNKNQIKRMLIQELERIEQKADLKY